MSLADQLFGMLDSGGLEKLGAQLGVDSKKAAAGAQAALPVLLGALARNTGSEAGATALADALERDHDGSVLERFSAGQTAGLLEQGGGILRHVLGGRASKVEEGVAQVAGLGREQAGSLVAMLAPLVMGALGRTRRESGLDAGGLARLVQGEAGRAVERAPQAASLLTGLLDADGDGDVDAGDLLRRGSKLLGGLFGGDDR